MRIFRVNCVFVIIKLFTIRLNGTRGFTGSSRSDLQNISKGTLSALKSTSTEGRSTTMLHDDMSDVEAGKRQIYYFDEVTSTMDKVRELAKDVDAAVIFAVVADRQSNGRGTRGRTWMSGMKNLHLTISIPLSLIKGPLTLTPLRMGTLIRPSIASRVQSDAITYLKWPNDILIGDKKVCGTLIEVDNSRMLVGIGCNIGSAPVVDVVGSQAGRPATCIADHNPTLIEESSSPHHDIAAEIYDDIKHWISTPDSAMKIISDFQQYMNYCPQKLRDSYDTSTSKAADASGEIDSGRRRLEVIPLRINMDGTLQVRYVKTGEERALIADYLL